jgi:hypothetical protein
VNVKCRNLKKKITEILFYFLLVPPYIRCPYPMVGQAVSFMVDIYVECYVHGYPAPRISW